MAKDMEKPAAQEPTEQALAETPTAPRLAPGTYIGPRPAPLISNLPDDPNKYHADELPERHKAFVIATIPEAKWWWV